MFFTDIIPLANYPHLPLSMYYYAPRRWGKNEQTFFEILPIKSSTGILNGMSGKRYGIGAEDSPTFL
ncbi:hypothetical protein CR513_29906, partial [Mucuna pruriens]